MNATIEKAVGLLEILPENDQNFALEFIRKLVVAWDPDFTKLTPSEREELEEIDRDIAKNGTIPHESINWDQITGKQPFMKFDL